MLVKKPWRRRGRTIKYNKSEWYTITDYIGYWLFGFIPVYLVVIDKFIRFNNGDEIRKAIYQKLTNKQNK